MIWGLIPLFIGFTLWPDINGRIFYEAYFGLIYLGGVFSWMLAKKIHWSVGLAFLIILSSGITNFYFPKMYPIPTDPIAISRGGSEILYSVVTILLFAFILLTQNEKFFSDILKILFACSLFNSVVIIIKFWIWHKDYAMFSSNAADATFIGCMLPCIFLFKKRWMESLCGIIMILAIGLTKSSTGLGTIGIAIAFISLQELTLKKWIYWMVPITIGICVFGHFYIGHELLNDNDRLPIFKTVFEFYKAYANPFFGIGTGTFTVWGDAAQRAVHAGTNAYFNIFIWLHNEPLEILFENGIIGLASALTVYLYALKRTFKRNEMIFSMLAIYGFASLTEMPLRLWVTQLLGVCLIGLAFNKAIINDP